LSLLHLKPIGDASRNVSPISFFIEELCIFFNTISGIFRLQVNNKRLFDTPLILTSIHQLLLKPPNLLRRHPETAADPGRLAAAFTLWEE